MESNGNDQNVVKNKSEESYDERDSKYKSHIGRYRIYIFLNCILYNIKHYTSFRIFSISISMPHKKYPYIYSHVYNYYSQFVDIFIIKK